MWGLGSILLLPGREGLILDKKPSFVPLSLKTGKCPIAPWLPPQPSRPHCISRRPMGASSSAAAGQGSQPSAGFLPPAQPCPGFSAPSPVIAAYLLSCHRWTPRPLATNDYISQHPLCTMVTQPSSPSMPRPNVGGSPAPINSLGPGVH